MSVIIGIDVGGSTTKIVGFRNTGSQRVLISPLFVSANDPLTSTYGAFGKFTSENGLSLPDIDKVMITGVGSTFLKNNIYGLACKKVPEFTSIGKGGLYLSGKQDALIVSLGTGTAIVHAKADGTTEYLGGTGVGGGTLLGLSKLLTKAENIEHAVKLAEAGDLSKIDLRIKDISKDTGHSVLGADTTAANFGKVSDLASCADIEAGIINLVFETVAMVSVFAARSRGVKDIVLTGSLTRIPPCKEKIEQINRMGYGVHFEIPEDAQFATVIGTALCGESE